MCIFTCRVFLFYMVSSRVFFLLLVLRLSNYYYIAHDAYLILLTAYQNSMFARLNALPRLFLRKKRPCIHLYCVLCVYNVNNDPEYATNG